MQQNIVLWEMYGNKFNSCYIQYTCADVLKTDFAVNYLCMHYGKEYQVF